MKLKLIVFSVLALITIILLPSKSFAASCEPDTVYIEERAERQPFGYGVGSRTKVLKTDYALFESIDIDLSRDIRNNESRGIIYVENDLTKVFSFLDRRKNK